MKKTNEKKIIKYLRNLILRTLSVIVIFLLLAIISKSNKEYKDIIVKNLYETNMSFAKIKNFYTKYLGGIIPLEKLEANTIPVFKEELEYIEQSIYYDGVKLQVKDNYLVPIINEGMVVYIGKKDNYENVVIIEGLDGIEIWYGNLNKISVKLYDYVESGTYLGTVYNNKLYLVYSNNGKFLDYREYLT